MIYRLSAVFTIENFVKINIEKKLIVLPQTTYSHIRLLEIKIY